jgi:hypothetical protein
MRNQIIENIVKRISQRLINERKSDKISLLMSRLVINQFKKMEDFEVENIYFERGDEYASFDLSCVFIEDEDFNHPFSVSASADMDSMEIEVTFRPQDFPKNMNDLVAEIKETIEHELEHIEQKNFEDMRVPDEDVEPGNFHYLMSKEEIPAHVRGLIKRAKTKRISLSDAMEEWFDENKGKFEKPRKEWPKVKHAWMEYANRMKEKQSVKKFK